MLVSEVVQKSVIPLRADQPLEEIHAENYNADLHYLPVVEGDKFIGFLPLADLEIEKELYKSVGQSALEIIEQHVFPGQHLFEVLVLFRKAGLNILPVIGEDSVYEGFIQLDQVLGILADSFAFQSEGGVLVLAIDAKDYSLTEISRLIESNEAKVLSVVVEADPFTHQRLYIHIKINQTDLSRIVATLERFSYTITEVHHKSNSTSLDQERLDLLMKYLGI
jgi:predicted transcriptional regulator